MYLALPYLVYIKHVIRPDVVSPVCDAWGILLISGDLRLCITILMHLGVLVSYYTMLPFGVGLVSLAVASSAGCSIGSPAGEPEPRNLSLTPISAAIFPSM